MEPFLALLTIGTLAVIAAAMVALLMYFIPKIHARHFSEPEPIYCDTCGRQTDEHSPWGCDLCLIWLCSQGCQRRHVVRRHLARGGGPEAA